jgi:hypothetical protein
MMLESEPIIPLSSRRMDKVVHLCRRTVIEKVFVASALGCLFGCGAKKGAADDTSSDDAAKTPATVEQAARILDFVGTSDVLPESVLANQSWITESRNARFDCKV